jgi:hypothetical protein
LVYHPLVPRVAYLLHELLRGTNSKINVCFVFFPSVECLLHCKVIIYQCSIFDTFYFNYQFLEFRNKFICYFMIKLNILWKHYLKKHNHLTWYRHFSQKWSGSLELNRFQWRPNLPFVTSSKCLIKNTHNKKTPCILQMALWVTTVICLFLISIF